MGKQLLEDLVTAVPRRTCDGRCQEPCKKNPPRCLVVAACGGLIGIMQKLPEGLAASPPMPGQDFIYTSMQAFGESLQLACERQVCDQVVIVGSANDMAWLRGSLPKEAQSRLVAEIPYPLLKEWLQEPTLRQLAATLTPLIQ